MKARTTASSVIQLRYLEQAAAGLIAAINLVATNPELSEHAYTRLVDAIGNASAAKVAITVALMLTEHCNEDHD